MLPPPWKTRLADLIVHCIKGHQTVDSELVLNWVEARIIKNELLSGWVFKLRPPPKKNNMAGSQFNKQIGDFFEVPNVRRCAVQVYFGFLYISLAHVRGGALLAILMMDRSPCLYLQWCGIAVAQNVNIWKPV